MTNVLHLQNKVRVPDHIALRNFFAGRLELTGSLPRRHFAIRGVAMPYGETWLSVWSALSDESLEHRLRHYYWLSLGAPSLYKSRFALLVAEAIRRGKLDIIENAQEWVAKHGTPPPL